MKIDFYATVRRSATSLVITIPMDVRGYLGLKNGQQCKFMIEDDIPVDVKYFMRERPLPVKDLEKEEVTKNVNNGADRGQV